MLLLGVLWSRLDTIERKRRQRRKVPGDRDSGDRLAKAVKASARGDSRRDAMSRAGEWYVLEGG